MTPEILLRLLAVSFANLETLHLGAPYSRCPFFVTKSHLDLLKPLTRLKNLVSLLSCSTLLLQHASLPRSRHLVLFLELAY